MAEFEIASNIRNLAGDLILALEDDANGLYVRKGGLLGQSRSPITRESTSWCVDGSSNDGTTLGTNDASLLVKVFGPNWVVCETRYQALLAAAPLTDWLYEEVVQGVSKAWRAGPVGVVEPPLEPIDFANNRRFVVLTFKVQPTPAVTYPGGL